jgi:hypothetical protein
MSDLGNKGILFKRDYDNFSIEVRLGHILFTFIGIGVLIWGILTLVFINSVEFGAVLTAVGFIMMAGSIYNIFNSRRHYDIYNR